VLSEEKAKPVEKQGRKATGLNRQPGCLDYRQSGCFVLKHGTQMHD
jgi:hypothetical protein